MIRYRGGKSSPSRLPTYNETRRCGDGCMPPAQRFQKSFFDGPSICGMRFGIAWAENDSGLLYGVEVVYRYAGPRAKRQSVFCPTASERSRKKGGMTAREATSVTRRTV